MESTAQYWRPIWYGWSRIFICIWSTTSKVRAPRGRKWDYRDAMRLADRWGGAEIWKTVLSRGPRKAIGAG